MEFAYAKATDTYVAAEVANAGLVEGMKGLFNPTDTVSRQFKNGMMGAGVLGFDEVNMSQSIKQHTTGSRSATASTLVKTPGVTSEGSSTILLEQGSVTTTIKAGDVFTIRRIPKPLLRDCRSV